MTPEGKIKKAIKGVLDPLRPRVWYDMPVPGGFGKSTLDFLGAAYGHPFAIEAKAAGGTPTERQRATIRALETAGVQCFVIEPGTAHLHELELWLKAARLQDRAHEVDSVGRAWLMSGVLDFITVDEPGTVDEADVWHALQARTRRKRSLPE